VGDESDAGDAGDAGDGGNMDGVSVVRDLCEVRRGASVCGASASMCVSSASGVPRIARAARTGEARDGRLERVLGFQIRGFETNRKTFSVKKLF
jgi:hypothetical protein